MVTARGEEAAERHEAVLVPSGAAIEVLAGFYEGLTVAVDRESVAALTDAQRGGLYWAVYRREGDGGLSPLAPEAVGPPEEVARAIPREAMLIGDGLARYAETFAGRPQADATLWPPRAGTLARLGWAMHLRGEHIAADRLEPLYVRRPAPEEVLERRKRGGR